MPVPLTDNAKQALATKAAEQAAGAIPLPGPVGDAFSTGPIQVEQFSVRKIVAYDWRILQRLNNSLLRQLSTVGSPDASESDDDSEWQLIWILTHTLDEVDAAIKKGGFESLCRNDIGGLDSPVVVKLMDAVVEQIRRSISTVLAYSEKEQDGEKKITAPASNTPPMASVGG